MMVADRDALLRLCVVQLDGIPHAFSQYHNLWIPAEPLVDLRDLSRVSENILELSTAYLFASSDPQTYREVQDYSTRATAAHLKEVLAFLVEQDVDIAVFPEYLLPISCLPDLVEFSLARAVVAGLEHVRNNEQASKLAKVSSTAVSPEDLLQRNVSVLVADRRVHLVTKRFLSGPETALAGGGPLVTDVVLRNRQVKLAVTVCMDYLRSEEEVRAQHAEIVCIPAYSGSLRPFDPDAPRDYVRLLSNCAAYGGSQIMMPALLGPLTGPLGVRRIAMGYEAVIVAEYDRYLQRPAALRRPENRLRLRAEIVEQSAANSAALTAIQDLAPISEPSRPPTSLSAVTNLVNQFRHGGPLAEALRAYHGSLAQGSEDPRLLELARTHLTVAPGRRGDAIRLQQAQYVVKRLGEFSAAGRTSVGHAIDAYSKLAARLVGAMPSQADSDVSRSVALEETHLVAAELRRKARSARKPPAPRSKAPKASHPRRTYREADLGAEVVPIRPGIGSEDESPGVLATAAESYQVCHELVAKSHTLLYGIHALVTASSADDFLVAVPRTRYRAAEVAMLLTNLTELVSNRSDFEWNNTIGAAQRNLTRLRHDLPSDARGARSVMTGQPDRSPLVMAASELHDATVRLKELTR